MQLIGYCHTPTKTQRVAHKLADRTDNVTVVDEESFESDEILKRLSQRENISDNKMTCNKTSRDTNAHSVCMMLIVSV
jgi:hypothetical protein